MIINSDFRDIYDIWSDKKGLTLNRFTENNISKRQQFKILEKAGYSTSKNGLVKDVLNNYWDNIEGYIKEVVIYENEYKHCGEGKRRLTHRGYQTLHPDYLGQLWCSAFIDNSSVSLRHLYLGDSIVYLQYTSYESWMSNVGDGDCKILGIEKDTKPFIKLPLYAVDFVSYFSKNYAIDFNTAPGIKGIGIEKYLDMKDVYDSIEFKLNEYGQDCYEKVFVE
jgi:hypothetical protein